MDLLTTYILGYFLIAVVAMALLEWEHVRVHRGMEESYRRQQEQYREVLLAYEQARGMLYSANETLQIANEQLSMELHHAIQELNERQGSSLADMFEDG